MKDAVKRVITGTVVALLLVTVLTVNTFHYIFLFLFLVLISHIALHEFYLLKREKSRKEYGELIGHLGSIIILAGLYINTMWNRGELPGLALILEYSTLLKLFPVLFLLILFAVFIAVLVLKVLRTEIDGALQAAVHIVSGIIYITFPLSLVFFLMEKNDSIALVWLLAFMTIMSDTMGYVMGKLFGKHKINSPVSPNKTWEGYLGGLVLQVLSSSFFYLYFIQPWLGFSAFSFFQISGVSFLIYISSVAGDLIESLMKRDAKIKDSGNILPGHGGVLDRIDSFLVTIPVMVCITFFI